MSNNKIKVVVGQVWMMHGAPQEYTITRIDGSICYHTTAGKETGFGSVDKDGFAVWSIGPGRGQWYIKEDAQSALPPTTNASVVIPAINDHVCPTCKNTRCSKTEKSCWRCGNPLH